MEICFYVWTEGDLECLGLVFWEAGSLRDKRGLSPWSLALGEVVRGVPTCFELSADVLKIDGSTGVVVVLRRDVVVIDLTRCGKCKITQ